MSFLKQLRQQNKNKNRVSNEGIIDSIKELIGLRKSSKDFTNYKISYPNTYKVGGKVIISSPDHNTPFDLSAKDPILAISKYLSEEKLEEHFRYIDESISILKSSRNLFKNAVDEIRKINPRWNDYDDSDTYDAFMVADELTEEVNKKLESNSFLSNYNIFNNDLFYQTKKSEKVEFLLKSPEVYLPIVNKVKEFRNKYESKILEYIKLVQISPNDERLGFSKYINELTFDIMSLGKKFGDGYEWVQASQTEVVFRLDFVATNLYVLYHSFNQYEKLFEILGLTEELGNISNESFDEWGFGIQNGKNNSIVTDIDETDKVKEFEHYVLDEEKDDEANIYVSEVEDTSSAKEGDVVQHRGDSLKEFSNEGLFDFFKRSSNNNIINGKMSYQEKIDTLTKAISTLPDSSNNIAGIKCNELAKYIQENNETKLKTLFSSFADFAKLQTNNDKVLSTVVSSVNKELSRKNITDIGDYKIDYFFKATSQLLPESNSNNWFGYTKNTLGNSLIEFYETDYDYGAPFASNLRPMDTEKSVNMVFDAVKDIKGFKQLLLTILKDSKVALDKYQKWNDARVIDKGYYEYSDEFVDVFNEYKSIIHYNFEEYLLDGLFAVSALYELLSKSTVTNSTESIAIPKQESLLDKLMKISYNKNVSLEDEENKQDDTDETETTEDVSDEPSDETDSEDNQEEETDEGLSSGAEDSGDGSEETGGESSDSGEGEDSSSEDETESEEISEEREDEVELDQPDEEKILIKNYLEPLLGEDVNKVKLFTASEVNRPLYHISMNANIKSFTPQVSKRVLSKENRSIPRVSTSTSLVGCLNGYQSLVSDMDGREAKNFSGVFTVYNLPYQYAVKPDAKLLSDVEISDEYWLISWKKETFMTVPEVTATFTVPKIEKVYGNDGIDQTLHIYVKVRNGVLYIDHQRKLDVGCYHVKLEGYNFRYPLKNNNLIKINQISENDYNRVTSLSMMIKTR